MHALLLAPNDNARDRFGWPRSPAALRPVLDRPLVQHVVERLVDLGVTEFTVFSESARDSSETVLGDGRRWGSRIRHVVVAQEQALVLEVSRMTQAAGDGRIVLATADHLPDCLDALLSQHTAVLVDDGSSSETRWAGWAVVSAASADLMRSAQTLEAIGDRLVRGTPPEGRIRNTGLAFDARDAHRLLDSNLRACTSAAITRATLAREIQPQVWVERNVRLESGARLVGPVFIGQDSRIGAGTVVGPFAVVGASCLVDNGCVVTRSVVTAGTYVGEGLELHDVIADGTSLVNVRLGTTVEIDDELLLGLVSSASRLVPA